MSTALPRITARVDTDTQNLLSRAAAIMGVASINSFVLSTAIEKAKEIIEHEQSLQLSQRDAVLLAQALDAPARPHPRLQKAATLYSTKTQP